MVARESSAYGWSIKLYDSRHVLTDHSLKLCEGPHFLTPPVLGMRLLKPSTLMRAQTAVADLQLDREAMRAVGARLQDEQVRDARLDTFGLESFRRATPVEVGGAACLANDEQLLRVRPRDAGNLQLRLGLLVPSPKVSSSHSRVSGGMVSAHVRKRRTAEGTVRTTMKL